MSTSQSVVGRLLSLYQRTGQVADLPRNGRPRSTNGHNDRLIVNEAFCNCSMTSRNLQQFLRQVRSVTASTQTVRNRLHIGTFNARRPQVLLPFTARHQGRVWHVFISVVGGTSTSLDMRWTSVTGVSVEESGVVSVNVKVTLPESS